MVNRMICFSVRPEEDIFIAKGKSPRLDPSAHPPGMESLEVRMVSFSALLINAPRLWSYTPVSLPSKGFNGYIEDDLGRAGSSLAQAAHALVRATVSDLDKTR
jgi:hypothetical protein